MSGQDGKPPVRRRSGAKPSPLDFPAKVPFVETLGFELHRYGDGEAELRVDLDAGHLNTWDVAHGGVVMTLLDVSMAMAARSGNAAGQGVATIEMKTSFMRPAEHQLRAVGKLVHATATMAFCEGHVYDDRGQLCATASGTFKYLRGLVKRRPHVASLLPPEGALSPLGRPGGTEAAATPDTPDQETP